MESQKVRVLVLSNRATCLYNMRLETIVAFLDLEYEVMISSPYGSRIEDLKALGCSYMETAFNNRGTSIKDDLKLIGHYRKVMRVVKPDVVLTFMIKPNIYGGMAANKEKIPFIANITGLGTALQNEGLMQKVIVSLYRRAFKKVSFVFFQNEGNLSFFKRKRIAYQRGKLIPGSGVNLTKFSPLPFPDAEEVSFVFIARVMKAKGIDHYLEAAKVIKSKHPKTTFYVCGSCEESYEEILNEYQKAGIVTYLGLVDDVREVFKLTHCTILPSYHEGLSNVLLESAASSCPNITTNINGCKEVVEDGMTGILVEPKSTESLIQGIERFLNLNIEERKRMGEMGRLKVEKEFDRQLVVDAYLEVVDALIQEG